MSTQQPKKGAQKESVNPSLFDRIEALSASVPQEEWDSLPKDLARNYKHYLYGHSKQD